MDPLIKSQLLELQLGLACRHARPTIQRFLALRQKVMPLINGCHSRNRSGLMVENLIGDVRGTETIVRLKS